MDLLNDRTLTDPEVMRDPYPFYRALHAADARVVPVPGVGYWIGRMKDIREVSRDTVVYSNSYFGEDGPLPTGVNPEPLQEDVQAIFASGPPVENALWTTDPPVHSLHRKLVNKAFTRRWVEAQENAIRGIANDLIDATERSGEMEFMSEFAIKIPLIVIADALGVPREDIATFRHWSDDILAGNLDVLSHQRRREVATSWVEATRYFADTVEARRLDPQDDLISSLATAEIDGDRLKVSEILPIISTLLLAGNETTANLIGNGMRILLERPELMARLRADWSLIPAFLEEVMRFDAPVQCLYRVVTRDTELGGVRIPAGSNVMLGWGSAGHDPDIFERPEEFILERENVNQHVGFGYGPHLCVGLMLARAEARIAFETLLDRLTNLRRKPGSVLEYVPTYATRGLKRLDLLFDA
jgi:cytochrome P450